MCVYFLSSYLTIQILQDINATESNMSLHALELSINEILITPVISRDEYSPPIVRTVRINNSTNTEQTTPAIVSEISLHGAEPNSFTQ